MFERSGWSLQMSLDGRTGRFLIPPKPEHCGTLMRSSPSSSSSKISSPRPVSDVLMPLEVVRYLPFVHQRQLSGVVVKTFANTYKVLVKGSPEAIAQACAGRTELIPQMAAVHQENRYYTLAAAWKELDEVESMEQLLAKTRDELESGLAYAGLLMFRNETKASSKRAIAAMEAAQIRTIMCTGDNLASALAVAHEVGMIDPNDCAVGDVDDRTGGIKWSKTKHGGLESLSERHSVALSARAFRSLSKNGRLAQILPNVKVVARMTPRDKAEFVVALQESLVIKEPTKWEACKLCIAGLFGSRPVKTNRATVAMVGDGGNDCGALERADVGISLCTEQTLAADFSIGDATLMRVCDLFRTARCVVSAHVATTTFFVIVGLMQMMRNGVMHFLAGITDESVDLVDPLFGKLFHLVGIEQMPWSGVHFRHPWAAQYLDFVLLHVFAIALAVQRPARSLVGAPRVKLWSRQRAARAFWMTIWSLFVVAAAIRVALQQHLAERSSRRPLISDENSTYRPFSRSAAEFWGSSGLVLSASKLRVWWDHEETAVLTLIFWVALPILTLALAVQRRHRGSVLRNRFLMTTVMATFGFVLYMILGGPSCTHCLFRVNCDTVATQTCPEPLLKFFQLRKCFTGTENAETLQQTGGNPKAFLNGDCQEALLPEHPSNAWPSFLWRSCVGGNNCFDAKSRRLLLAVCGTLFAMIFGAVAVMTTKWRCTKKRGKRRRFEAELPW